MGDRWYESQNKSTRAQKKEPRKLKSDWIKEINELFREQDTVEGLDKCTVVTLKQLYDAVLNKG